MLLGDYFVDDVIDVTHGFKQALDRSGTLNPGIALEQLMEDE
jgi:hypothetical protein